jgi:hypothetical protein
VIASRRHRLQAMVQNGAFAVLMVAAALLIAVLAGRNPKQWDITQNARNSLSQGSVQLLASLKEPVKITAYASLQDPTLGDIRKRISDFIDRYRRVKADISLDFIDPREQPKAASAANIRVNGEMVVEYQGRSEHLTALDEQALTTLLTRLARGAERQVLFLDGHGERKPDGGANHDLGEFGKRLAQKELRPLPFSLATVPDVPANAALLVIASPLLDLLPVEVARIRKWIEGGGNLFWMIDQEPLRGLQPVADFLGLQLSPGVVVDPAANELKASATLSIASAYPRHALTRGFSLSTAFPLARRIAFDDANTVWRFSPLVEVAQTGWVETGALDDRVGFDRNRDTPGPVTVMAALERDLNGKTQRVVVAGSGHFLANTYAGLLGNLDLGVNVVNWLSGDDSLVTLQPRSRVDGDVKPSRAWLTFIAITSLLAVPLAFLFTGGMIWWQRRRA